MKVLLELKLEYNLYITGAGKKHLSGDLGSLSSTCYSSSSLFVGSHLVETRFLVTLLLCSVTVLILW